MERVRSKLTFSSVTIGAAVLVVGGAGTAYAANEWTGANIVNDSLTGKDVKKDSLKSSDIGDGQVKSLDILDGAVTGADIADGSLTGDDIADATVIGDDLAGESITSSHILDATITGADIEDGAVTSDELLDDTIRASDIAGNAVGAPEVDDFSLTNQDVGVLFAQVNADGTVANSSGGVTATKLGGSGNYEVDFGRNTLWQCAFTGTVGPSGAGSALGHLNVADRAGVPSAVFVDTNNADGSAADLPFHLIVVC